MSGLAGSPGITPFLWFDQNAEEAADFYISIFPNSRRSYKVLLHPWRARCGDPLFFNAIRFTVFS
jgi:predicted 3-demethylubiquinone-9 3-methyltransferase (glyoxalase superfamily)